MNEYPTTPSFSPPPQTVRVSAPSVRPIATYVLAAVTVFFYILQVIGQSFNFDIVTAVGIKDNTLIRAGELWRLITPLFLHASILHIAFNMYALIVIGRGVEARFGHGRYLLLYFLSGFAGNVFSFLLTPDQSLGASTAIMGLLAAEGIFIFQNRHVYGSRARGAILNILFVAGVNLLIGFTPGSGVDNFGHIGGILGGILFTWIGGPRLRVEGIYPAYRLVDEREGHGSIAGTAAVLLIFIPLAVLGWIFPH
jgi:rhomboid protease GluP